MPSTPLYWRSSLPGVDLLSFPRAEPESSARTLEALKAPLPGAAAMWSRWRHSR